MNRSAPIDVGELLRGARISERLSQNDVASRAGVAQSVVSAYEAGRRSPSLTTLQRLVEATGHELVVGVKRSTGARPGLPNSPLGRRVRRHRRAIVEIAARSGVTNLKVFGSVARGEDRADSDVDLVGDVAAGTGLFALGALRHDLEQLLGVPVDLAPADGLKPRVRAELERDAVPL